MVGGWRGKRRERLAAHQAFDADAPRACALHILKDRHGLVGMARLASMFLIRL